MSSHKPLPSEIIYRAFRKAYESMFGPRDEPDVIHVSEASMCLRKAWYYRTLDIPIPDDKVVVLTIGGLIHRVIQPELTEFGYSCEALLTHDLGPFTLVGHADALNESHVIELKSVTRMPRLPYRHHLLQANAYAVMAEVPHFTMAYISKAGGYVRVTHHEADQGLFDLLTSRACELFSALKSGKPPKPEPSRLCKWCSAYPICRGLKRLSEMGR